jgi:PhzF family phenazine biosynthesis protein
MIVQVHRVRSFTDSGSGGNPAGVVLDADALDSAARQGIAAALGWSETAFVSHSDLADARLEFYTPNRQIAHCGHATVATFGLLRALGRAGEGTLHKDTVDGLREIRIEGDTVFMAQQAPIFEPQPGLTPRLASLLDLPLSAFDHSGVPTVVSTGTRFLQVGPIDAEFLAHARPDQAGIEALSEELDLVGLYVHARGTTVPGRAAATRMFAPRYGIPEESATGIAAGGLAALLHERGEVEGQELVIEQGRLMRPASPSQLRVRLELQGRKLTRVFAGGTVRMESIHRITREPNGQWRDLGTGAEAA